MKLFSRLFQAVVGGVVVTVCLLGIVSAGLLIFDVLQALAEGDCIGGRRGDLWTCDQGPSTSLLVSMISHPLWLLVAIGVGVVALSIMFFRSNFKLNDPPAASGCDAGRQCAE